MLDHSDFVSLGSMNQNQRLDAMAKLKQYHCRVLISTDLVSLSFELVNYMDMHPVKLICKDVCGHGSSLHSLLVLTIKILEAI